MDTQISALSDQEPGDEYEQAWDETDDGWPGLSTSVIIVSGHLEVDPDDRDAFVADSAEAVRLARAAPGCLDFAVSADSVDPGRVNVFERWDSTEALMAFRGDGPDDDSAARVRAFHVDQHEVVADKHPQA